MLNKIQLLLIFIALNFYAILGADYCDKSDINDCVSSQNCGKSQLQDVINNFAVSGGVVTGEGEFPWQVLIAAPSGKDFCGGAIINDQWVLTAAHCVALITDSTGFTIRLGVYNRKQQLANEFQTKIKKFVVHKDNDVGMITNDIALIRLKDKLDFSGKHKSLAPICLATSQTELTDNCLITGFAMSDLNKDKQPAELQKSSQPVVDTNVCAKVYDPMYSWNIDNEICVGTHSTNGFAPCVGDGGSPIQCLSNDGRWYLTGLMSYGPDPCGKPGSPDVYTKVAAYTDWIDSVVNAKK